MDISQLIQQGTFERSYLKCSLTSSINPALAFAMNHLAELEENDRILDPCCGSGTILIERQILKPCICIGVDIDPRTLDCAKQNIEAASISLFSVIPVQAGIQLKHGDIIEQKLPNNYFTKIISNLPFGIHSGSREENKQLYRFLADSAIDWLKPGGKAILLTNAKTLLKNSFAYNPSWKLIDEIPVAVGGLNLSIFIYQKLLR